MHSESDSTLPASISPSGTSDTRWWVMSSAAVLSVMTMEGASGLAALVAALPTLTPGETRLVARTSRWNETVTFVTEPELPCSAI